MGLSHEVAHALANPVLFRMRLRMTRPEYENAEEKRVIRGPETQIARDLGLAKRFSHFIYSRDQQFHGEEFSDQH